MGFLIFVSFLDLQLEQFLSETTRQYLSELAGLRSYIVALTHLARIEFIETSPILLNRSTLY